MLQLLGMRAEEASQQLLPALAPAAETLMRTSRQLSAWLAVLQEAVAATERAQAAHSEAARIQVGFRMRPSISSLGPASPFSEPELA